MNTVVTAQDSKSRVVAWAQGFSFRCHADVCLFLLDYVVHVCWQELLVGAIHTCHGLYLLLNDLVQRVSTIMLSLSSSSSWFGSPRSGTFPFDLWTVGVGTHCSLACSLLEGRFTCSCHTLVLAVCFFDVLLHFLGIQAFRGDRI